MRVALFALLTVFATNTYAVTTTIADRKMTCDAAKRVVVEHDMESPAAASSGRREILINPSVFKSKTDRVQWFIFNHECGHLNIGGGEKKADLYAVGVSIKQGWFDQRAVEEICDDFGDSPGGPEHPPGRERCRYIGEHYKKLTGKSAGSNIGAKKPSRPARPERYPDDRYPSERPDNRDPENRYPDNRHPQDRYPDDEDDIAGQIGYGADFLP